MNEPTHARTVGFVCFSLTNPTLQVAKQDKAHASLVRVDAEALGAFIGR